MGATVSAKAKDESTEVRVLYIFPIEPIHPPRLTSPDLKDSAYATPSEETANQIPEPAPGVSERSNQTVAAKAESESMEAPTEQF